MFNSIFCKINMHILIFDCMNCFFEKTFNHRKNLFAIWYLRSERIFYYFFRPNNKGF